MKFQFSLIWIFFLILAFYSNALKTFLILFLMLLIHESFHVLTALFLHYQVDEIKVIPFGFHARIRHLDHGFFYEKILILTAGLTAHLLFPILIYLCYRQNIISFAYMDYLMKMNQAILFFNLLPIYPLDGGRILLSIIHLFFNYALSKKIIFFISIIMIGILFQKSPINLKIMLFFLLGMLLKEIKDNDLDLVEYHYQQRKHFKVRKNHV